MNDQTPSENCCSEFFSPCKDTDRGLNFILQKCDYVKVILLKRLFQSSDILVENYVINQELQMIILSETRKQNILVLSISLLTFVYVGNHHTSPTVHTAHME
jgi:hypothetical protein